MDRLIDEVAAKEMYDSGASDLEIAKHFGATVAGVVTWRRRNKLVRSRKEYQPIDRTHIKPDCFSYNKRDCRILLEMSCAVGKCRFYKTKEQFDLDNQKSKERLGL